MSLIEVPGSATQRYEIATGLLVRGIRINGHYLIADQCDVFPRQKVGQKWLIQGGPRVGIADFDKKQIEGQISCPVRIDRSGILEPAIWELLNHAQYPTTGLEIDTNHVLSHIDHTISGDMKIGMTTEDWGTDNNRLVKLDCVVVKELTVSSSPSKGVTLTASFVGTIDTPTDVLVEPPPDYLLGRQLSWADCNAARYESAMRLVSQLEVKITNDIKSFMFLNYITAEKEDRTEQTQFLGVKTTVWNGSFEETLRKGVEAATYIHGGFMVGEYLALSFGPITSSFPVPVFEISEQPLPPKHLIRKTNFFSQDSPTMKEGARALFSLNY